MRSDVFLACVTFSVVALTAASCSRPAFVDTTGEAPSSVAYPSAPYGFEAGATLYNYDFVGFADAAQLDTSMQAMALSDFYNPHGKDPTYQPAAGEVDDRYFPADSAYANAGKLKPTVLLVQVAAVWCEPCNLEAATILPAKHATYAPCGGEFLLTLNDSGTMGVPASPKNLLNWTSLYKVDYPAAIDPEGKLQPIWQADAIPENIVVDLTTMKIVEVLAGEAVVGTCNNESACSVDADCQSCEGLCSDGSGTCSTAADCPTGVNCENVCGDGSMCTTNADCAAKKCSPFKFWTTYESYLDKTRTGCSLQ
jgi:hypothetical protein